MIFITTLFMLFTLGFFLNFTKKVSMLLTLEGMALMIICYFCHYFIFETYSCFFMMLITIFMVLDSVLGMTLLIFGCRNSSNECLAFLSV